MIVIKKLIIRVQEVFDKWLSTDIECSIGDLLLKGDTLDNGQVTVTTRYYDVLCYKNGKDKSFPFQNALSYVLWGEEHDSKTGNENFENLIISYDNNGYQKESRIILWNGIDIANGTHRVAMCFYHGVWEISAKVKPRGDRHKKGFDWYLEHGLSPHWENILEETREKMVETLFSEGATFGCLTEELNAKQSEVLETILTERCKKYRLSKNDGGGYFQFSLRNPYYIIKHGRLFSREAERLYDEIIRTTSIILKEESYNCSEGRQLFLKFKDYRQ